VRIEGALTRFCRTLYAESQPYTRAALTEVLTAVEADL